MKNPKLLNKKDWWYCDRCETVIKDRYPLKLEKRLICAISDKDSCPNFLKTKIK